MKFGCDFLIWHIIIISDHDKYIDKDICKYINFTSQYNKYKTDNHSVALVTAVLPRMIENWSLLDQILSEILVKSNHVH